MMRERKECAKIGRKLFFCRRSRTVSLSFLLQHALAVGSSPTTQIEPLLKQFQIVLLEALGCVCRLREAAMREADVIDD